MKQKIYILLLTIMLLPTLAFSTCIIIIKTKTEIFVGADSKRTVYTINKKTGKVFDSVDNSYCKIRKVNNFYFAISGYDDIGMLKIATKICETSKTLKDVIENYPKMMIENFEHTVEVLRTVNMEKYINLFVGSDIAGISFFCFMKSEPQLVTLFFKITNNPEDKTVVAFSKVDNQPIIFLGVHDHLDKLSDQKIVSIFKEGNMVSVIRALIKIEIKNHPNWIGEPIDILRLNQKGELWISRKKKCI